MWDYDKLFAQGNIIGVLYGIDSPNKTMPYTYEEFQHMCSKDEILFRNESLSAYNIKIQYIIRLDEHGNVVEKLFDREKDMKPEPEPMPELKDGMFIRVAFKNNYLDQNLGFVNLSQGRIIYQEGGYDWVDNIKTWKKTKIIEIYDPGTLSFHFCRYATPIWRSPEYQSYLDSKV